MTGIVGFVVSEVRFIRRVEGAPRIGPVRTGEAQGLRIDGLLVWLFAISSGDIAPAYPLRLGMHFKDLGYVGSLYHEMLWTYEPISIGGPSLETRHTAP